MPFAFSSSTSNVDAITTSVGGTIPTNCGFTSVRTKLQSIRSTEIHACSRSSIAITGHRDHRYLSVTVDDDGPGIPANLREEVFKPFLRLDDARNQDEGGTGLGLPITRRIIREHGGDLSVQSQPGKGASFIFTLPKKCERRKTS